MHRKKGLRKLAAGLMVSALILALLPALATPAAALDTWDGSTAAGFASGDGLSAGTAYVIHTGAQLAYLADQVNNHVEHYSGTYFALDNDLDMNGQPWTAIGETTADYFSGILNGNGHTISNYVLTAPSDHGYSSLFGYVMLGSISNLNVETAATSLTVTTPAAGGEHWYIAALAGRILNEPVTNCHAVIHLTASVTDPSAHAWVGGLVAGQQAGTITGCASDGTVQVNASTGGCLVGGLVCYISDNVSNSDSSVDITGFNTSYAGLYAGGFAASATAAGGFTTTISNCHYTGTISAVSHTSTDVTSYLEVGGFISDIANSPVTLTNCTADATINNIATSAAQALVGGFTGEIWNSAAVANCTATSTISNLTKTGLTTTNCYTGGFTGTNRGTVSGCSTTCGISNIGSGFEPLYVGGFTGRNMGPVSGSQANITISGVAGASTIFAGGFTGTDEGNLLNCASQGSITSLTTTSTIYLGGFTGIHNLNDLTGCNSTVSINTAHEDVGDPSAMYAGGFAGMLYDGNVAKCSAAGDITASNINSIHSRIDIGGFAGYIDKAAVNNCYSTGGVHSGNANNSTPASDVTAGGFAGFVYVDASVDNCYSAAAAVTAANDGTSPGNTLTTGGFAGLNQGEIVFCYWLKLVDPAVGANSEPLSTTDITDMTTAQLQNTVVIVSVNSYNGDYILNALNSRAAAAVWTNDPTLVNNHGYPVFAPGTNYTVTLNLNGGQMSAATYQSVAPGGFASEPNPAPTKSGFTFDKWYSDSGFTTPYVFATTPVTGNITIYAKWVCTVTFETNGGSAVASQVLDIGGLATEPNPAPTKGGWVFAGWYDNAALTNSYSFSWVVTANKTLYAKWTPAGGGGGGGGMPAQAPVLSNGSTTRVDRANAAVTFMSDSAGSCYFQIVKAGAAAPAVGTSGTGLALTAGTNSLKVTTLATSNAYDIYIVGKTPDGTLSNVLKVAIPENNDIAKKFSDIGSSWALHYAQLLYDAGIRLGRPDGTMQPDAPVTKAELAALLVRALKLPAATAITMHFGDMDSIPDWARYDVQTCVDQGILQGDGLGFIRASDPLSRFEAAVMLFRTFSLAPVSGTPPFPDAIPDWAASAVNTLVSAGVLAGYPDGTFSGADAVKNGEIDKMLCVLLKLV